MMPVSRLSGSPQIRTPLQWEPDDLSTPTLFNLKDSDGQLLAWIDQRPAYCDRGHWVGNIEVSCELDGQDAWPHYFMSLNRAKMEVEEFIMWRFFKVRSLEEFYSL